MKNYPPPHFPIEEVRSLFPALKRTYKNKPVIYFDGPGGSQVVLTSIEAITTYMLRGGGNLHGPFPTSVETEQSIEEARSAVADLLKAKPSEIAFGQNSTSLAFSIARALSRLWDEEDEVVVTEIDHRTNVDPWVTAAIDKGMAVRWIPVHTDNFTLDVSNLDTLITNKTKVVAVTLASNAVGTIIDVEKIANRAKEVGALVVVDAVHAVPHFAVDQTQLGADILLCSAYKFFGPHVGIALIREGLFESLTPYKVKPAPTYIPDKLETGTQNHEGICGIKPAIEFIENLGIGSSRRERIVSGYERIEEYENYLADMIRKQLASLPQVILYQAPESIKKTPTIAFRIEGISPKEVCKRMVEEHSIFIANGDFYASTLADKVGIAEDGGWIRAGLAPYNTEEEVRQFLTAIEMMVVEVKV